MKGLLTRSLMLADAGLAVKKTDTVKLNDLVKSVARMTIPSDIEFTMDELPVVICDEEKLFQVFKNLFENALTHGNPKKIEIKCFTSEKYRYINVINDGVPIHEDIQEKISETVRKGLDNFDIGSKKEFQNLRERVENLEKRLAVLEKVTEE